MKYVSYNRNLFLKIVMKNLFLLLLILSLWGCDKPKPDNKTPIDTNKKQIEDLKQKEQKIHVDPNIMIPKERIIITNEAVMMTSKGKILLGLYGKDAPKTVVNFIGLAKRGFYNEIKFHRVAKDFLIQAGDRLTLNSRRMEDWGTGGESIFKKEFDDELDPETPSYKTGYIKGTLAMANRGPNTNKSQFFICLDDAEKLEHNWTIFGRVLEGIDVVEKIASVKIIPGNRGPNDGIPLKPVIIYWVKIKKHHNLQ
jgi:cyclophilin family peptidyl-prolyl cis-trans isomerase